MDQIRRAWLDKRIESGICLQCGKLVGPRSTRYCDVCVEIFNDNAKKRAIRLRETGICIRCQQPAIIGKSRCVVCLDKEKEERKQRKSQWLKDGCCFRCGEKVAIPGVRQTGKNKCVECIFKHAAWAYLKNTRRWRELRELLDSQNEICPYSGRKIAVGIDAELDHIVPRSNGGTNEFANLQWVHSDVNKMKSHQSAEAFLNLVAEIFLYKIKPEPEF